MVRHSWTTLPGIDDTPTTTMIGLIRFAESSADRQLEIVRKSLDGDHNGFRPPAHTKALNLITEHLAKGQLNALAYNLEDYIHWKWTNRSERDAARAVLEPYVQYCANELDGDAYRLWPVWVEIHGVLVKVNGEMGVRKNELPTQSLKLWLYEDSPSETALEVVYGCLEAAEKKERQSWCPPSFGVLDVRRERVRTPADGTISSFENQLKSYATLWKRCLEEKSP